MLRKNPELLSDLLLQAGTCMDTSREACGHFIETAMYLLFAEPVVSSVDFARLLRLLFAVP